MDPAEFGISSLPLQHTPYKAISPETIAKANKGKVAVVTGAAGGILPSSLILYHILRNSPTNPGIGAAIALSLAKSGTDLALLDLPSTSQETTKLACEKEGVKIITYDCNVADLDATKEVFSEIEKDLGAIECVYF